MRGLLTFIFILAGIATAQQWEVGVQQVPLKPGARELVAFWQKGDTLLATCLHKKGLILTGVQNNTVCLSKFFEIPKGYSSMKVKGLGERGRFLLANGFNLQLFQLKVAGEESKLELLYSQLFEEESKYMAKYDTANLLLHIAATAFKNRKTSKVYRLQLDERGVIKSQQVLEIKNKLQVLRFLSNDYEETIGHDSSIQLPSKILENKDDNMLSADSWQDAVLLEDGSMLTANIRHKVLILKKDQTLLYEQKLEPRPVQDYLYPVILSASPPYIVDVYLNGYRAPYMALQNAPKQDRLRLTIAPGAQTAEVTKIAAKGVRTDQAMWGNDYLVRMTMTVRNGDGRIEYLGGKSMLGSEYGPCLYRHSHAGDSEPIQRLFISQAVPGTVYLNLSIPFEDRWVIPVIDRKWLRLVYCTPPAQE